MTVAIPGRQHLPPRPFMPTAEDQQRVEMSIVQYLILSEKHDEVVRRWLEAHVSKERLAKWGPPDTRANPVADICRQLSTPGLYGRRPTIGHLNRRNDPLIAAGGILDRAGWAPKLQTVQFFTLGLGNMFIRPRVVNGELEMRLVHPHNVYIKTKADAPGKPVAFWEMRLRYWTWMVDGEAKGEWIWAWDRYDISDPDAPSFSIHAVSGQVAGTDVTARYLRLEQAGPLAGDAYPWRDAQGRPVIPYAHYCVADNGEIWHHYDKRGAFRGTLNTIVYMSYAGHCARDATGAMVIVAGLRPWGGDVIDAGPTGGTDNNGQVVSSSPYVAVQVTPGAVMYHEAMPGAQPFVQEVGPGANLQDVAQFARNYATGIALDWGLNPADVERQHANPTSGAALAISNEGKRKFSEQAEEVFRPADLQLIRLCAIECRLAGLGVFDEDGYSVTYQRLERSPEARAADRDDMDWEMEHGHLSEVEAYQRRHPGATPEQAVAALTQSAVYKAKLAQSIQAALQAEGLAPPPAPSPGDDPPNGDDDGNTDPPGGANMDPTLRARIARFVERVRAA